MGLWRKFVLIALLVDLNGVDDRRCGLPNVLRMDFVGVFGQGRDFVLDRELFFQSEIRMNFLNGRLGVLTYVLLLIQKEAARN